MSEYKKRLEALAGLMDRERVDALIIPMNDYHGSEYVGDYFKFIEYYTGFTGSAGTLLVLANAGRFRAYLWTDGRYFIQAASQLEGSGVRLMKMGEPGVATLEEYLSGKAASHPAGRFVTAFDGRLFTASFVDRLSEAFRSKGKAPEFIMDKDLAGLSRRVDRRFEEPELMHEAIWVLSDTFAGRSREEKLAALRDAMRKKQVDAFVMTRLDEIAWLFNLRGNDVDYNPVFLAYAVITSTTSSLFLNTSDYPKRVFTPRFFNEELFLKDIFQKTKTDEILYAYPYGAFYKALKVMAKSDKCIWYDRNTAPCLVDAALLDTVRKVSAPSPIVLSKAVKNETEQENFRLAHAYDGAALTKLIYFLKTKVRTGETETDELGVAEKLVKLRSEQPHYLGESFAPIIAFREHGAIVHYEADEDSNMKIKGDGLLLMDTGGHYLEGTTDVTRTISMYSQKAPSEEEKRHYTAVLQGNLRLADAVFKTGTPGSCLDILAREPLYRIGEDFNHGTGHGVGYLLNVHEGPQNISLKRAGGVGFEEGMITSDEPGVYLEGKYGIRLEDLTLCRRVKEAEADLLCFETLTAVPFDHELIDYNMLTEGDKELLKKHEEHVYETIKDLLDDEVREWLKEEIL